MLVGLGQTLLGFMLTTSQCGLSRCNALEQLSRQQDAVPLYPSKEKGVYDLARYQDAASACTIILNKAKA